MTGATDDGKSAAKRISRPLLGATNSVLQKIEDVFIETRRSSALDIRDSEIGNSGTHGNGLQGRS